MTDFTTWLSPECLWLAVFIYFLGVLFVWEIVEVEEPDTEWRVALFWGYCAIMLIYLRLIGKHPQKNKGDLNGFCFKQTISKKFRGSS